MLKITNTNKKVEDTKQTENVYNHPKPYNLALQGGGMKGLAHLGTLKFLYLNEVFKFQPQAELTNRIHNVVGSSAGAYVGLAFVLFSLGFRGKNKIQFEKSGEVKKSEQKETTLEERKALWNDFQSWVITIFNNIDEDKNIRKKFKTGYIIAKGTLKNLFKMLKDKIFHDKDSNQQFSVLEIEILKILVRIVLKDAGLSEEITFKQLFNLTNVNLTATATDTVRMEKHFFNHKTTPDLKVVDGVSASMSFPIVFAPLTIKEFKDYHFSDGGVLNNFPIDCFDKVNLEKKDKSKVKMRFFNEHTLGLKLIGGHWKD
jgi:predicted acylesterase/phospholipase RssA